jgi:P27 family predicted phage terminase small subunit
MGRRPDGPGVQAAKGHPGKRKSKVKERLTQVEHVAKLLAEAPASGPDVLSPPAFIADAKSNGALAVWKQLAPRLRETHRLSPTHRLTFAMFCSYFAEWVWAQADIETNGYTQTVPLTGNHGVMERLRPSVKIREIAFGAVMDLSKNFGLTPTDEYALFAHQRLAAGNNPGLFDTPNAPAQPADGRADPLDGDPPEAATPRLVGGLGALDSEPPPGRRPN